MGKNKHSKDRLFVTRTEWARDFGGKKVAAQARFRGGAERSATAQRPRAPLTLLCSRPAVMPFDHCALSFRPVQVSACAHRPAPRACVRDSGAVQTPVCTRDGSVFDLLEVVPYIRTHKVVSRPRAPSVRIRRVPMGRRPVSSQHPVSGEPLTTKDLIRVRVARQPLPPRSHP